MALFFTLPSMTFPRHQSIHLSSHNYEKTPPKLLNNKATRETNGGTKSFFSFRKERKKEGENTMMKSSYFLRKSAIWRLYFPPDLPFCCHARHGWLYGKRKKTFALLTPSSHASAASFHHPPIIQSWVGGWKE